jgi:hypothetical protein
MAFEALRLLPASVSDVQFITRHTDRGADGIEVVQSAVKRSWQHNQSSTSTSTAAVVTKVFSSWFRIKVRRHDTTRTTARLFIHRSKRGNDVEHPSGELRNIPPETTTWASYTQK